MIPAPGLLVTAGLCLERLLGTGGMGSVWLARRADGAEVAVKIVADEIAAEPEIRERFLREALAAARLSGPSVVNVLDYGTARDGTPYLVMELCRGETLRHRMERAPVSLGEAARVVAGVASALAFAHAAGIVHRDVKPDNVFLEPGGVKLGDFGIAKHALARGQTLTATGTVMGTPAYMSPEQILFTGGRDPGCDLWATAVLAYELVVGRRPFDGEGLAAIARAVCSGRFALPSTFGLPAACDAFFARAFALDAAARFASAPELAQAFRAAAGLTPDLVVSAPAGARPDDPTAVAPALAGPTPALAPALGSPVTALPPALAAPMPPQTAARAPARRSPRLWALGTFAVLGATAGGVAVAVAVRGGASAPDEARASASASTRAGPPRTRSGGSAGVVTPSRPTAPAATADDSHAMRLDQEPQHAVGRWTTAEDGGIEIVVEAASGGLRVASLRMGGALVTSEPDEASPLGVLGAGPVIQLGCVGIVDGELRCVRHLSGPAQTLHFARDPTPPRARGTCERADKCAQMGSCTAGPPGGPTCVATRRADCEASSVCHQNGGCTLHMAQCVAVTDADCRGSMRCRHDGRCTPRGFGCVVGSDADCAASRLCTEKRQCVRLATGVCGTLAERR